MVTPGEAATIKVEPSLLKPAARTSSVPVMVNGSRCPASCSAAMPPARINSRQPWPVRFGSRPPAMPQTSINSPATGPMPNAGRSSWVEPVALLVPGTDNYRAGGHLDNPSALVADNQEEVGHGREADLRKAAHGHVPNLLPPRNHPMIMPEVRHWPASSSAAVRARADERTRSSGGRSRRLGSIHAGRASATPSAASDPVRATAARPAGTPRRGRRAPRRQSRRGGRRRRRRADAARRRRRRSAPPRRPGL